MYIYCIEDGQFSREIRNNKLLGNEGSIIKIRETEEVIEIYILYIEGNIVHCIGNIERNFPENLQEHDRIVKLTKMQSEKEYLITYMNSDSEIIDTPITITSYSKEEASKVFKSDYPHFQIYEIN